MTDTETYDYEKLGAGSVQILCLQYWVAHVAAFHGVFVCDADILFAYRADFAGRADHVKAAVTEKGGDFSALVQKGDTGGDPDFL